MWMCYHLEFRNSKVLSSLAVAALVVGSVLFHMYLYFVRSACSQLPLASLYISAFLLSIGILLFYKVVEHNKRLVPFFLVMLYFLTLTLLLMWSTRFSVLSGVDNLFEFKRAGDTLSQGYWPIERQGDEQIREAQYIVSLVVSAWPAIFSMTTGIDLILVFKYVLPMIESLIPVFLFLSVKEAFRDLKIASIAAIIYSNQIIFFYQLAQLHRQLLSTIFVLLFVLVMLKGNKPHSIKWRTLSFIVMFGIVASHYTMVYLLLPLVLVFFALHNRLFANLMNVFRAGLTITTNAQKYFSKNMLLLFLVLSFSWLIFLGTHLFNNHIRTALVTLFGSSRLVYNIQNYYIFGSPFGIVLSVWSDLLVVCSVIGLICVWFSKRKSTKLTLWTFAASIYVAFLLLWFVTPGISTLTQISRVWGVGGLFLIPFAAHLIMKLDRKTRGILLLIFIIINLPINLALFAPKQKLLFYNSSDSLKAEELSVQIGNTRQGFLLGMWANRYTPPTTTILGDLRVREETFVANNKFMYLGTLNYSTFYLGENDLLVLSHYYLRYGLWVTTLEGERVALSIGNVNFSIKYNVVYDSNYFLVLRP